MENKILAKVNGREITEVELNSAMTKFPKENQQYFATEQGKEQLLQQLISFELMYNYAKEKELDKTSEYEAQLEILKKDLLIQAGIRSVLDSITVSDEEVKEFYESNKEMFKGEESVRAKHILVDSEEKAAHIRSEIEAGKSFEDAAQEYSSCPSSSQGGDLGTFTRGRMVPEFENAAFELELHEVSQPVQTQFGYHLIKVEEKTPAEAKSFEEVENSLRSNLLSQKQNSEYIKFIDVLKEKQDVQILL